MFLEAHLFFWLVSFCTALTPADSSSPVNRLVMGSMGKKVILPCNFSIPPSWDVDLCIKWTKLGDKEVKVLQVHNGVTDIGPAFKGRVSGPKPLDDTGDASLTVIRQRVSDAGLYRCEIVLGAEATEQTVSLEVFGVCFHYRGNRSRYSLNFDQAKKACADIDASIALPEHLLSAYEDGYDQCDAGWLYDQTVRYPIVTLRKNCDSKQSEPGVRTYGKRNVSEKYDVYCYAQKLQGEVFYAGVNSKLTLSEAREECVRLKAALASTGQLYAAWRQGTHRCDYGWLSDGSVRFPFSNSKSPCDKNPLGVRTFYRNKTLMTFPLPNEKFGAYCFTEHCEDHTKPEEQKKAEGDSVVFSFPCVFSKAHHVVEWQFEGNPILDWFMQQELFTPVYKQRAYYDDSTFTLELINLTIRDSGKYKITVHFSDRSSFNGETSLRVFKNIEDVKLIWGEEALIEGKSSAYFTCDAAGDITFVKWLKNGEDLSPSDRISFSPDGGSVSINPVMRSDTGGYQCTAGNPVTSQTTGNITITINYGPEDVRISGPAEANVGSIVSLSCSAASEPSATLGWSFNGSDTGVTEDTFLIPQSDVTHSGEYSCAATNHITERSVSTSHALLVKVVVCPRMESFNLPGVRHRRVQGNGYEYGSEINFYCNTGYNHHGPAQIKCQADGKWNWGTNRPTCNIVVCPRMESFNLPHVRHQQVHGYGYEYGSEIQFSCHDGYSYKGPKSIKCQADGKWNWGNSGPTCVANGCFPGLAWVFLEHGRRKVMKDLSPGDKVLAADSAGNLVYSDFIMFVDRASTPRRLFHVLETKDPVEQITLTASHLLFVLDNSTNDLHAMTSTFASSVRPGQRVMVADDSGRLKPVSVARIFMAEHKGLFSPLTAHGTIVVDGILASCYGVIDSHSLVHWAFAPVRLFYDVSSLLFPSAAFHQANATSQLEGLHWYPKMLRKIGTWLLDRKRFHRAP